MDPVETAAMRRALRLAAHGLGRTNPNPVVGAVVLGADGAVAGSGWHAVAGGPHAEVVALAAAGGRARGGTAVVTLEPCAHTGRTAACTEALLHAGVRRVVYAVADPHPRAAGGAEVLRAGGVEVASGLLADEAEFANSAWLTAVRRRRPFLTWKFAASLDGRSAAADGTSRWISGPESRADVHRLRAESDAVLVGIGTVLADDPGLTVRAFDWPRQPTRIVAAGDARTPLAARVLDAAAPTLIAVRADADPGRVRALRAAGADLLELPAAADGHVDLAALVAALFDRGLYRVLAEGGPTLAGGLLAAGLIDRVIGYLAPTLLGAGPVALGFAGVSTLAAAVRLRPVSARSFGVDLRVEAHPVGPGTDLVDLPVRAGEG